MTTIDHAYAEEHGLVDAYLQERLSESERDAFEAHFFNCETCLAQLEMASDFREGMRDVAAEETVKARLGLLAGLAAASWANRIAMGAALLLLLALPFGLLLARNRGLERQLADARTTRTARSPQTSPPTPTRADPRLEAEMRALRETLAEDMKRMENELAEERQSRAEENRPQVNVPIFMLAAVRSGEEAGREPVNRIPLPSADGPVILTVELATVDDPAYHASLRGKDGKEIWQSRGLRPDSRDTLTILLPTSMLAPGVYELTIEGEGKGVAVGAYPFRVVRP
jgi:hypothetical protein